VTAALAAPRAQPVGQVPAHAVREQLANLGAVII
jgi:hypothetical protein